jgi:two-component system, cell cycle sensor histidine kinase and response regulator CckA
MGPERTPPKKTPAFRVKAGAGLKTQAVDVQGLSLDEIRTLAQELLTHQVELERQNEELRQAQDLLARANNTYGEFYDWAPVGFLTLSESGVIKEANLTAVSQLKVSRNSLIAKPLRSFIKDTDIDRFGLYLKRVFQKPGTQHCEIRLKRPDGSDFYARLDSIAGQDAGEARMCRTSITDITMQMKTQVRLECLLASSPAAIYTLKPEGNLAPTYVSENVKALVGWKSSQFLANPRFWIKRVHPKDRRRVLKRMELPWPQDRQSYEYRFLAQDGAYRWMHDDLKVVRDLEGQPVEIVGAWVDITERKTLESQLIQAQKMEAVGRLAGGVAHDFNNLLMAIMGYGELIRTSLMQDDPLYHYSEDILKATERAASLTQQLLTFSRRQIMQPQVLNLNGVVADLEKMLRRLIGEHIDLEIVAGRNLGSVKADPGQIGQIIMNLAVNARDAMPTGGRLTLETANLELAVSHQTHLEAVPPGRYVRLTVRDTGEGMDAATVKHIFEPFFTTKEMGKGTGLGLPTVYGIVKQNHGYIEVDSRPGQGATFRIYLPRLEAPAEAPRARMTLAAKLEGSETILVVEDEDALRTLLCRFFRLYGYNVLEARHGGEALLLCERHPGPIALMVSDVVMPQMSGQELADRLISLHPEMKVFFMSGYTDSDLVPYGAPDQSKPIIFKPFRPMDLVKKVREFLDESRVNGARP